MERSYTDFKSKLIERRKSRQIKIEEVGSVIQVNPADEKEGFS